MSHSSIPKSAGQTANSLAHFEQQVAENRYLDPEAPGGLIAFSTLPDNRGIYPAYYPQRPGENYRLRMGRWDGGTGEFVGVSLAGQLYRQFMAWGNSQPEPGKWRKFDVR